MAKVLLWNATAQSLCLQRLRDFLDWRTLQDVQAMSRKLCSSYMGMGRNATWATSAWLAQPFDGFPILV